MIKSLVFSIIFFNLIGISAFSQKTEPQFNLDKDGVLLEGYDIVSYFIGSVAKGKASIKVEYQGAFYWFSSVENKEIFEKNPEKFVPAYGGWCAYAMGDSGEKVKIDPETYKIIDGTLFLFYNFYFNNTLIKWNMDEKRLIEQANINWSNRK